MDDTACLTRNAHKKTTASSEHSESATGLSVKTSHVTDRLISSFNIINQRFFQGKVDANIIWQVPNGLISINKGTPCYSLNSTSEQSDFDKAKKAIEQGKISQALTLLTPLADKGHADSELLVCHILKRRHGNWQPYAKAYNDHFMTEMMAPAACYYPESKTIAIHPHLLRRDVPMFVLRYLIYHECCHQILASSESEPHPPVFMEYEANAPFREKSLVWLEKEGFPTLPNTHSIHSLK